MLFDLRGHGRRRAVRVIYIGLALLMGVGLVGFGIGGGFGGGGLFSAATNNEGASHAELRGGSHQVPQAHETAARQLAGLGRPHQGAAA